MYWRGRLSRIVARPSPIVTTGMVDAPGSSAIVAMAVNFAGLNCGDPNRALSSRPIAFGNDGTMPVLPGHEIHRGPGRPVVAGCCIASRGPGTLHRSDLRHPQRRAGRDRCAVNAAEELTPATTANTTTPNPSAGVVSRQRP